MRDIEIKITLEMIARGLFKITITHDGYEHEVIRFGTRNDWLGLDAQHPDFVYNTTFLIKNKDD